MVKRSLPFSPKPALIFIISQISFSNDNPEQNETIEISASLKIAKMNLTDNKTEYIYVGFYQDNLNNEIDSIRVNASDLRKGIEFEKVVLTTWKATSGEYTIIAVVDSTDIVKEGRLQHENITDFMPQLFFLDGSLIESGAFTNIKITNKFTSEQCLGDELMKRVPFATNVGLLNSAARRNAYSYSDGVKYHVR